MSLPGLVTGSDPVAATLKGALDGLLLRQKVAADNIANVDTPGFVASRVEFEGALRSALVDGSLTGERAQSVGRSFGPAGAAATPSATVTASTDAPGANGNNVDLAAETMTAMQATFRYQLLSRAVGDRYSLITTAIGGM
ncbi:MAG TPA: flagellar basal body rod protein FlgB [Nocardioidaceae bacterium]|jgi:flagellar basal-body rod protein FlgB|nr:flagellar basal body rod protein FlgB [Nocardioidaceae bacterium]